MLLLAEDTRTQGASIVLTCLAGLSISSRDYKRIEALLASVARRNKGLHCSIRPCWPVARRSIVLTGDSVRIKALPNMASAAIVLTGDSASIEALPNVASVGRRHKVMRGAESCLPSLSGSVRELPLASPAPACCPRASF